jgi:hypothetical protein
VSSKSRHRKAAVRFHRWFAAGVKAAEEKYGIPPRVTPRGQGSPILLVASMTPEDLAALHEEQERGLDGLHATTERLLGTLTPAERAIMDARMGTGDDAERKALTRRRIEELERKAKR